MNKIIPRWEWRTFGQSFLSAEKKIKELGENPRLKQSSEIYILSNKSNDNTKIRDELMDIKTLIRQHEGTKLEQWTVLSKSNFPIHINELALVFKAFGVALPYLEKDEYSYDDYLTKIIADNPELKMVNVQKERHGYLIDDAIVEFADVMFDENKLKTLAVEHTDPKLVVNTVRKLGLEKFENINYIKAMKRTFGLDY